MPPGKRQQSNAMLYGLVISIFIAILAVAFAVVFYIKAEEHKSNAASLQKDLDELATTTEVRSLGKIVGTKPPRESWMSLMVGYDDHAVATITGGVAESTSAEVKDSTVKQQLNAAVALASKHFPITDPNTIGLVPIIQKLDTALDASKANAAAIKDELAKLQAKFDDTMKAQAEERELSATEKAKLEDKVSVIQKRFDDLETLLQQTADQRAQTLMVQLDDARKQLQTTQQELSQTKGDLGIAQSKLKDADAKLFVVSPPPDANAPAYMPDGKVILVDDLAKVVQLSLGSDDHVFKGLTFSVYDRGAAVTREADPKAEVQVFDIYKNYCVAKITKGSTKRPILTDDLVANLIWDKGKVNVFTVIGDFDLNSDGHIDAGGADKVKALVQKWGGRAQDTVSADTDFIIVGSSPAVPKKPSAQDLELDPGANDKYQAALTTLSNFQKAQELSKTLWIPMFKYKTFLDFIGFNSQVNRPGVF